MAARNLVKEGLLEIATETQTVSFLFPFNSLSILEIFGLYGEIAYEIYDMHIVKKNMAKIFNVMKFSPLPKSAELFWKLPVNSLLSRFSWLLLEQTLCHSSKPVILS